MEKDMPQKFIITIILFCCFSLFSFNVNANRIYKCIDRQGNKSFQDVPCDNGAITSPMQAGGGVNQVTGTNNGNGKSIYEHGKGKDVPACGACHGAEGKGNASLGSPRLAGQDYQFLYEQLNNYANNLRKDKTYFLMNGFAKALSDQDRHDVAMYASSLGKRTKANMPEAKTSGYAQTKEESLRRSIDISPLHRAVIHGDMVLIKNIIAEGANVNEKTKIGTPLMSALRRGNVGAVKVLLDNNADPSIKDAYDNSVLHAIVFNQKSLVYAETFVNMGVDINAKNKNDKTPLHVAVETGSAEAIERLISLGADVNVDSKHGSPLLGAINNKKIVQLLLSVGANPNTSKKDGTTPLILSARSKNVSISKVLLDAGADPNYVATHWGTALHAAVRSGRIEMAELLLMSGVDVNAVNCCGNNETALHNAVTHDSPYSIEIIDLLIEWGANINARGVAGRSPLIEARNRSRQIVEHLISKGANVNDRDDRGYSVLWWYTNRRSHAVETLINNGARLDLKNGKDREALNVMRNEYPLLISSAIERR